MTALFQDKVLALQELCFDSDATVQELLLPPCENGKISHHQACTLPGGLSLDVEVICIAPCTLSRLVNRGVPTP